MENVQDVQLLCTLALILLKRGWLCLSNEKKHSLTTSVLHDSLYELKFNHKSNTLSRLASLIWHLKLQSACQKLHGSALSRVALSVSLQELSMGLCQTSALISVVITVSLRKHLRSYS